MRSIPLLACVLSICVVAAVPACGDDDGGGGTDASPGDGGAGVDGGGTGTDAGPSADAATTDSGATRDSGSSGGSAPVIRTISWTHGAPCETGSRALTVTIDVEDADTPPGSLTFDGFVGGCTGRLDAATSTVTCSGASSTIGTVTVTDEGGRSDMRPFNVRYCEDGSQTF